MFDIALILEFHEFLSFIELEESSGLKHYVSCIVREIMHSVHSFLIT
jgi:hypothetical protein